MDDLDVRRAMMAAPQYTINDYVQDGIVFWLDGIENTRNGHDASSSTWQDLTSSNRDMTYNGSQVIADKYCILNGKSTITRYSSTTTSYTIELVLGYSPNTSVHMIMPWRGNNFGTCYVENRKVMFRAASTSTTLTGILMEDGINTYTARGNSNFRTNGVASTTTTLKRSASNTGNFMGYYNTSYPWPCSVPIYAIRIYNRTLTDDEVFSNALVDAARFK